MQNEITIDVCGRTRFIEIRGSTPVLLVDTLPLTSRNGERVK